MTGPGSTAAAVGRASLRDRLRRVWVNAPLILQTSFAASASWFLAERVLGHTTPFFAPIAAIIVLGNSIGQRLQRGIELMVGVAVGILVGDVLIMVFGNGPLQLGLVIMLAVAVASFLGTGALLTNQAAASAVLIATLYPPSGGLYYTRWIDALIGGALAFVVHALVLPIDPVVGVRRAARPVLDALATALYESATALRGGEAKPMESTLADLRGTDAAWQRFSTALSAAAETVAVSPFRWRLRPSLEGYQRATPHLDHALRNARVLARRELAALRDDEPVPASLPAAVETLGQAVHAFRRYLDGSQPAETTRKLAGQAAAQALAAYRSGADLSTTVVAAQIRSIAMDLLLGTGLAEQEARETLGG